jgi:hypothetical protein
VVKKYIWPKAINIQIVPLHNHQVNAAKLAIATFKEHFITALTTVDMLCPLQLWDEYLLQVKLSLNMLHSSQKNPKKSAYQEVYGSFDFNKTPQAMIQDHELPGRHVQPTASTLDPPPTTTDASHPTFLQRTASASPTPGACTQPTAKSQLPCNMTSPLQWWQTSSRYLVTNHLRTKSSTY